jgi:hypothetical protein
MPSNLRSLRRGWNRTRGLAVEVVVEVEQVGLEQGVVGVLVNVGRRPRLMAQAWMDPSGRRYQPAYTPSAGWHMAFGTSTLAVGKPRRRPRLSPVTTGPAPRRGGRAAGSDVDLTAGQRSPDGRRADGSSTPSGRSTRLTGSTSKSISRPSSAGARRCPRGDGRSGSRRRRRRLGGQPVDEDLLDEVVGGLVGAEPGRRPATVASRPVSASSSSRVGRSVRRRGRLGRTTLAGWRSNVTTTLRASSAAASRRTWATTAVWPRWTRRRPRW